MPFTIGEIPIGDVVDGELVLRGVTIEYGGQDYARLPSTPPRGRETPVLPLPPPLPGGNIDTFKPQLPGGVRPPDYRTEAPKPPVAPPPKLPTPIAMPPVPSTQPMPAPTPAPLRPTPAPVVSAPAPLKPAPAPVFQFQPPDASANTIKLMRDNLAKYNEYRAKAQAAATRNEPIPAPTREAAIAKCQLFQSVANSGESYYEAMIRNEMVPRSQLMRENLPTTPPQRLPDNFCEDLARI